jgi:peptidoglycan/LPS O-acetylase OafA/YrhL
MSSAPTIVFLHCCGPCKRAGRTLGARHRFATLDGLRGVLALTVVSSHLTDWSEFAGVVPHAPLAVDLFYLLSGFVIAFAYDERLTQGRTTCRDFVITRVVRLYPLMALGLVLGSAVLAVRIITRQEWGLAMPVAEALAFGALMIPSHVIGGPGYDTGYPLNSASWSLFYELVANFLYAYFARLLTTRAVLIIVAIGAAGLFSVLYRNNTVTGGESWSLFLHGAWRILFSFSAGVLLFRASIGWTIPVGGLGALSLAMILAALMICPLAPSWGYDSLCLFIVFPIMVVLGANASLGDRATGFCLMVGRISYPLSVLHYPLVRVVGQLGRSHDLHGAPLAALLVATGVASIALAAVALVTFDEPVRAALRERIRDSRTGPSTKPT